MTDAAAASAAAPAEQSSAPIEHVDAPPNPLSEAPPAAAEAKPEPVKAPVSTREALKAAAAKVETDEAAKAAAAKDPAKDPSKGAQLERDQTTGKFAPAAPKEGDKPAAAAAVKAAAGDQPAAAVAPAKAAPIDPNAPKHAAPDRFSPDAKAVWDTAPEPVKAEVARMHREMTQGIEKHRAAAERDQSIAEFHELAAKSGIDVKTALTKYVGMEQLLRTNPLQGLEAVCKNVGVSLREVAQIVLGQTPDQEQSRADATIRNLESKIERLEQQVGGVTQTFQQQRHEQVHDQVEQWASTRPHFDLYAPHIASEMRAGATSLDDAEARVFEKYPALAALAKQGAKPAAGVDEVPAAASAAATADLEAQTRRGQKSIAGAPGSGSEPAAQPRSSSIKEALKRAAARAG